ncbi:MAG: coenzyme F420-0:L-glutamate ligase [Aggregatilineales bacterium]
MTSPSFTALALPGIPLIQPGDDIPAIIQASLQKAKITLQSGDVLVISSKIISKYENQIVQLDTVQPRLEAYQLADETGKDPRIVELILQESQDISRKARGVLVTVHRLGFTSANAGIDQSNVESGDSQVLLLPRNPDKSAQDIREVLERVSGVQLAIVVSDTHGRPFRMGNVGVAIGVSGVQALVDLRGETDLYGRVLQSSSQGYADLLASAAHLLCGEAGEGYPVILLRGLQLPDDDDRAKATDLYRLPEHDLYR